MASHGFSPLCKGMRAGALPPILPGCRGADLRGDWTKHDSRLSGAMLVDAEQTNLKLKLTEEVSREFKARASASGASRDEYASAALHFALADEGGVDDTRALVSGGADVYLSIRGPHWLREALLERGDCAGCSVASYSGMALAQFLERHERDPRELIVLYHVDAAMRDGEQGTLAEAAFDAILERCGRPLLTGVAPAFMANWFFNRFRSRIARIESEVGRSPFTPVWVKERFIKLEGTL